MSKRKVVPRGGSGGGGMAGGSAPGGGGLGSLMGGGGPSNVGAMMQQIQKLQEEMAAAQEALKEEIVEASVGGGMVSVRMTGANQLAGITIKPEVVDPDDIEMLQDLIVAAFTEAMDKANALAEERMAPFASMLDMGSLGGMF